MRLTLTIALFLLRAHPHVPAEAPVIHVIVTDLADTSSWTVAEAERHAARILRQAGVDTEWQRSREPARSTARDTGQRFTIRLIIQRRFQGRRDDDSRPALGAAPETQEECGGAIYLFYDRIADTAHMHQLDIALVMGHVIAHEIGHRLLPHSQHSPTGLMRFPWKADDLQAAASGLLLFSANDAEAVRQAASSCGPDR